MTKAKYIIMILFVSVVLFFIPNVSNAAEVSVTRNIYSNNGSMKFNFKGLTLDTTHEYQYGLTKTKATEVGTWHLITEYTESTAIIDVMTTTKDLREVINTVDTGYITIKDKTSDTVVLQPYSVDLKIPYLRVTNYTVIQNGKELGSGKENGIQVALRCASNSKAYYQYEKITDQNIINKYKSLPNTKDARKFMRVFLSGAIECTVDKQGRTNLSTPLIEYAKLNKECVIIGVSDHLEIWDNKTWQEFMADSSDISEIADSLFASNI